MEQVRDGAHELGKLVSGENEGFGWVFTTRRKAYVREREGGRGLRWTYGGSVADELRGLGDEGGGEQVAGVGEEADEHVDGGGGEEGQDLVEDALDVDAVEGGEERARGGGEAREVDVGEGGEQGPQLAYQRRHVDLAERAEQPDGVVDRLARQ